MEQTYAKLYKKVDATAKTRFHASRRLRWHSKLSTYTIVLVSLNLILISLLQTYDLGTNIHSKYIGLIQVFSAITVLVYSLIIDNNDFSTASEKMYSCASELSSLKLKLQPYRDKEYEKDIYDKFSKDYQHILKVYEIHSINDFRADYYRAQLEMPEDYTFTTVEHIKINVNIIFQYILNFLSYIIIVGALFSIINWLLFK